MAVSGVSDSHGTGSAAQIGVDDSRTGSKSKNDVNGERSSEDNGNNHCK